MHKCTLYKTCVSICVGLLISSVFSHLFSEWAFPCVFSVTGFTESQSNSFCHATFPCVFSVTDFTESQSNPFCHSTWLLGCTAFHVRQPIRYVAQPDILGNHGSCRLTSWTMWFQGFKIEKSQLSVRLSTLLDYYVTGGYIIYCSGGHWHNSFFKSHHELQSLLIKLQKALLIWIESSFKDVLQVDFEKIKFTAVGFWSTRQQETHCYRARLVGLSGLEGVLSLARFFT